MTNDAPVTDPQDINVPVSTATDTGNDGDGEVDCQFCRDRTFPNRKKLMVHMSLVHFKDDIMLKFPFQVIT